jgi:alpha-glucosidase (family GH31 glycosyl hydrolase)
VSAFRPGSCTRPIRPATAAPTRADARATVLRGLACVLAPALSACGGSDATPPAGGPGPVDVPVTGFAVRVEGGDRLVVSSSDGRALLDGLAPADVADDAPPLTGFAVRARTTSYEMQFGSFKPTDSDAGPWRVVRRISSPTVGGASTVDLLDADGVALAHLAFKAPGDGHLAIEATPGAGPERRFSWGFACDDADHFNGFGAQTWDVDHRGQTVPTFVQEEGIGKSTTDDWVGAWFLQGRRHSSQVPIPTFLARRGYVLTAETPLRAIFALCSESPGAARVEVDLPATIHVFDGPEPQRALERSSAAFGRPRMPPRVAFAPWNDAILGSASVRETAKALRDAKIPSSVIWTEDWRGGDWNGDNYALKEEWEVDRTLYPDIEQVAADLHGLGFDFHVYFNPFVYVGSKAWAEVQPKGWLVKKADGSDYVFTGAKFTDCGLLDLDAPEARAWAVGKMQKAIALGADGWMNDYGEWLPTDGKTAAGPSLARHNLYPVSWQQTARQAIDGVKDGKARLFFGRSGWLGSPPLVDVTWAGDQRTDMEPDDGLPTVVPIGIGLGVVGISTYGHDIAGYQSATNPPSTKEVFFRWTELGAWTPVMRTHHGTAPKKEWNWRSDAETTAHFRRYATLHMALVPYLEGLAKEASTTGMPIWRGLALEFPEDAAAWPLVDEVLVGAGVLVAPVMKPGATSRAVYLPAGRWYPFDGGAALAGGATVQASAPLAEIPVYARAGAVVPTYPDGVMTLAKGSAEVPDASTVGDDRVVYAFLGDSGAFTEASGLAYALEHVAAAPPAALSVRWEGKDLAACASPAKAPCVEPGPDGAIARVIGPGTLEIASGGATLARARATGGSAGRHLVWVVRR